MSNLPKPFYNLWEALSAALSLAHRALEEVRALRREPGPRGDPGPPGKNGMGFDDLALAFEGRTLSVAFKRGSEEKRIDFKIAVPLYRGVFKEGETYERGDMVTWDGSLCHCNAETTTEKPHEGVSKAWQVAAKRGRDGREPVRK